MPCAKRWVCSFNFDFVVRHGALLCASERHCAQRSARMQRAAAIVAGRINDFLLPIFDITTLPYLGGAAQKDVEMRNI
jgi:hypothetical protein